MSAAALEFDDVTFGTDRVYDSSVSGVALGIAPGDLAIVLLEKERVRLPLGDLAVGILTPDEGHVRFHGRDWLTTTPDVASDNRGRIGRVFEGSLWIDGIEVSESIMLAQQHHTRRPIADILR